MFKSSAAILAAFLFLYLPAGALSAQDVTLTARDGSMEIDGHLRGFDGEFYRIETDVGVLTVDSAGVRCDGPACPDILDYVATVRISGDPRVVGNVVPALLSSFASRAGLKTAQEGDTVTLVDETTGGGIANFTLSQTSNAEGFADLLTENGDIVASTREITQRENEMARQAGVGDLTDPFRARVVALDALVPIVSRSNTLGAVSVRDLARLFAGEVTNWNEISQRDAPVVLHLHQDDVERRGPFWRLVMSPYDQPLSEQVVLHTSYETLSDAVEADPYAIGIGRLSQRGEVGTLSVSGGCGFFADAAPMDVKTEDYPMTRPVFFYTPARRLPKVARDFLDFVVSPAAQIVIARTAFVDQGVEELSFRVQGRRFANAIAQSGEEVSLDDIKNVTGALQGAKRLTLGFRFEDGSVRLDAPSRSNALQLAGLLEAGVYDGRSLLFAGFSDGNGSASVNQTLSTRRAQAVRDTVLAAVNDTFDATRVTIEAQGYGEVMPLACDDVGWGRSLNRRVEVWVRD
ncbi:phosphate ABC transporter substrate-binding/OmpA family protein [Celeribacter arenosi]|uniref:Phosphate ABC transporter substrate-binding/OmpA family protein n=1 Tax=Celeribacter arenosi TaxID=792649 RepID=A0ABP7JX83_9RHOB